jgi:hypothetical protein
MSDHQSVMEFAQNDDDGAIEMYGIGRDGAMVQDAGSVQTRVCLYLTNLTY